MYSEGILIHVLNLRNYDKMLLEEGNLAVHMGVISGPQHSSVFPQNELVGNLIGQKESLMLPQQHTFTFNTEHMISDGISTCLLSFVFEPEGWPK